MQSEIEARAAEVLARVPDWLWDGWTLPVPVEHIADSCFGLHIRDVDDLRSAPGVPVIEETKGLSGLLLPSLGEIWVNAGEAREWPGRRRFTISHELGHWCLHRSDGAVWCRQHAVDPPEEAPRQARPPAEAEADEFAAALLMPSELVRHHYERLRRRDDRFAELCRTFGASGAAMGRRLHRVI
jgi:IrrE N-terminal-like domain